MTSYSKIPETPEDIGKHIYTFLHLAESDIFQLMYVDVDPKGNNEFQILGRVKGEKVKPFEGDSFFLVSQIEFKLVNMSDGNNNFMIRSAEITRNSKGQSNFEINIESVSRPNEGVDFILKTESRLKKNQLIDCHVKLPGKTLTNRNGRPCNLKTYF